MRVAIIFDNFGPYHLARLRAAARVCDLLGVEVAASSAEYAWAPRGQRAGEGTDLKIATLLESGTSRTAPLKNLRDRLGRALEDFQPDVVFIPGWSGQAAFAALSWCLHRRVPAVAMSESTAWDQRRVWLKEWVKAKFLGHCSAALVGGQAHKDYLVHLGMPAERVALGYDAVDNDYFAPEAAKARAQKAEIRDQATRDQGTTAERDRQQKAESRDQDETTTDFRPQITEEENGGQRSEVREQKAESGKPRSSILNLSSRPFFLASARFVEKKNLLRLIEAYARYRELAGAKTESGKHKSEIWDLVLLGDGPLRSAILNLRSSLGLDGSVHLPGFKQYPDLPAYYGCARVFIHASTTEQWGLVVNEAMASGLPVLVSGRCGCAADLVQEGCNGFTFDPHNVDELAGLMSRVAGMERGAESGETFNIQHPTSNAQPSNTLTQMGDASRRIVANWGTAAFAAGVLAAGSIAMKQSRVPHSMSAALLLRIAARGLGRASG